MDEANTKLVDMEMRSFAFVRGGELDKTSDLLEEYQR